MPSPGRDDQPEKVAAENKSPRTRPNAIASAVGMTNSTAISFRVIAETRFDLPLTPETTCG
jgi:hypothetical protein